MTDSDDFTAQTTARDKYDMDEKPQTDSMLARARRAAARDANAKEHAFTCYMCWKHGIQCLEVYDRCIEGPEQFVFTCWKCKSHPKKKYASLQQVEKFDRAYPKLDILGLRIPPAVWPPEPRLPTALSEASRENFEKLFGKD